MAKSSGDSAAFQVGCLLLSVISLIPIGFGIYMLWLANDYASTCSGSGCLNFYFPIGLLALAPGVLIFVLSMAALILKRIDHAFEKPAKNQNQNQTDQQNQHP